MKLKVTIQVNQMPFSPFFLVLGLLVLFFCWVLVFFCCVAQLQNLTGGEYGKVVIMCSAFLIFSTA